MHVVANALDYSKVEKSIDQFLGVVDSFLYNIAKESDNRRRTNLTTTPVEFIEGAVEKTPEGIKSPIQRVH